MDIDPAMFKKILEYLYMMKISEDIPPLPEVATEKKDMFDTYVDFSFVVVMLKSPPRLSRHKKLYPRLLWTRRRGWPK